MTQAASFLDCDVVIVNYNAGKLLADCVSSVFAASAARAIVVDNNSTDGSLEHLERMIRNEKLSLVRNRQEPGVCRCLQYRSTSVICKPGTVPESR